MRQCPSFKSWQTVSQGDINYDGDLNDAAIHHPVNAFTTRNYVIDDFNQGGSWEYWPSHAVDGEGHHMMMCSNAGTCDYQTGECKCFDGYTGDACQRMDVDCGENGRALTLEQALKEENPGASYNLWDKDMIVKCRCDPGWTGLRCKERVCPKGDDPLTKTNQVDSMQIVQIWDTAITDLTAGGDIGGTFTLTFTDQYGASFTTSDIQVERYGKASSNTGANHATAVATKAALEALPDSAIPSVTVRAAYCESALIGAYTTDWAAGTGGQTLAANSYIRCPNAEVGAATPTSCASVITGTDGTGAVDEIWEIGDSHCGLSIGATTSVTFDAAVSGCTQITYPRCIQLMITFDDPVNTGDQNLLVVDHSKVTHTANSLTNVQTGGGTVASTVVRTHALTANAAVTSLVAAPQTIVSLASTIASNNVITLQGISAGATTVLPAGMKVDIFCGTTANPTQLFGEYTIASTATAGDGNTVTLNENLVDYHTRCTGSGNYMKIDTKTDYIKTDADISGFSMVEVGQNVNIGTGHVIKSSISSIVPFDVTNTVQYLLLETPHGSNIVTPSNGHDIILNGAGTKEAVECSSRGLCDTETGDCVCSKGYWGDACSTQNALSMEEE